jgi:hypothetical protein
VRVLMETTVAIIFILQKNSKQRTLIYHAHGMAQSLKMVKEWTVTAGLKRRIRKKLIDEATNALANFMKRLPQGIDVRRHWSGQANLRETVKALKGDAMYATLYRHASAISHVADFGAHSELDPATGELIYNISATGARFRGPIICCSATTMGRCESG